LIRAIREIRGSPYFGAKRVESRSGAAGEAFEARVAKAAAVVEGHDPVVVAALEDGFAPL
jgi:hypothetical protein